MTKKYSNDISSSYDDVENLLKKSNAKSDRVKPALVLVVCFAAQALSMGFFVSFGTIYVELIDIFKITETRAGKTGLT